MKTILCFVILFHNPFRVLSELPFIDKLIPVNDHPTYQGYGAGYDHPDQQHHRDYHRQGLHGSSGFYSDNGHRRQQPQHLSANYDHDLLDKITGGHQRLKENSAWNKNRGEIFIKKAIWDQDEGRRHHLADNGHHDGHYSNHGHGGKYLTQGGLDEGYSRKGGHLLLKAFNEGGYNKENNYNKHHIPFGKHIPSLHPLVPIHEPHYNSIKHSPLIHEKVAYLKPILEYRPEVAYTDDDPYHNYDKYIPRPDPIVYNTPYKGYYLPGHYQKHNNYHQEHVPVYRDHQIKPLSHLLSPHGLLDHMPKYHDYREPPQGYDHPPRHHSYHEEPHQGYHQKPIHAIKKIIVPVYREKPLLLHKPDIYIPGVPDVIPDVKADLGDIYTLGSENQGQKQF